MSEDILIDLNGLAGHPLRLYAGVVQGIAMGAEEAGYDAVFVEADGLGVVHLRERPE